MLLSRRWWAARAPSHAHVLGETVGKFARRSKPRVWPPDAGSARNFLARLDDGRPRAAGVLAARGARPRRLLALVAFAVLARKTRSYDDDEIHGDSSHARRAILPAYRPFLLGMLVALGVLVALDVGVGLVLAADVAGRDATRTTPSRSSCTRTR